MSEFSRLFQERKEDIEKFLSEQIFSEIRSTFNSNLADAAIYSLSAGGKRFRPVLLLSSFFSGKNNFSQTDDIFYLACAIECIHTYSLIHDDLPSMDNDDFRRGMPTLHKKFSESTAILAGDALNSFGFYLLSRVKDQCEKNITSDLLKILHDGAGGSGMVSGQIEDIYFEKKTNLYSEKILYGIHAKKTGALIVSSVLLGNRLRKNWKATEAAFREYGEKIGLLFQITDDILDEEGTVKDLGKTPGKDKSKGKLTFPLIYGLEKSKEICKNLVNELKEISKQIETEEEIFFKGLPVYLAERKN